MQMNEPIVCWLMGPYIGIRQANQARRKGGAYGRP